tara:strand:+ start:18 stop:422 length:405 start_codon:yes stop_codon:yes gene_type:complete
MKLIADTNILFSFFKKESFTRKLLLSDNLTIISSEKAIEELTKYSQLIAEKAGITLEQFNKELDKLKKIASFEDKTQYQDYLKEAEAISPDRDDANFLAASLKHNCALWSNDKELTRQNKVKVINTENVVNPCL